MLVEPESALVEREKWGEGRGLVERDECVGGLKWISVGGGGWLKRNERMGVG